MSANQTKKTISLAAVIIISFAAIFGLSQFIEKSFPPLPDNYVDQDLAVQGAKLKGFTLGFDGLIADWYWMQSLQYVGKKIVDSKEGQSLEKLEALNPRLLYPFLDNATTLDPNFAVVYSYGAVVLPDINSEHAIAIAQKGIDNNPKEWRLYQHLGYIYWRLDNFPKAAETYEKGSQLEGSPPFMKMMAAKMKSDGGSRDTARSIYQQMYDEASDPQTKDTAQKHLIQFDAMDELKEIRASLQNFQTNNKRCAETWREILPSLRNVKLPNGKNFHVDQTGNLLDPTGIPYLLIKDKCDAQIDKNKSEIPVE